MSDLYNVYTNMDIDFLWASRYHCTLNDFLLNPDYALGS